jgi:hypothetical protein
MTTMELKSSTNFFTILYHYTRKTMDYSKYIQMKMEAANTYKSNWKGRDASEVTLRNRDISSANNTSTHKGPLDSCIPCTLPRTSSTNPPGNGFNTDYSMDIITTRNAGCVHCNDTNWGTSGGVTLKTCAEVSTILVIPSNPGSTSLQRGDPGINFRAIKNPCDTNLFPS